MTAENLYQATLLLVNASREDGYYRGMFLEALKMILEESLVYNNSLRQKEGKLPLLSPPEIGSFQQEIDYEPYLLKTVLPYGLAGLLLYEDNPTKATIYRNRYDYKLSDPSFCTYIRVQDVYGGGYGV